MRPNGLLQERKGSERRWAHCCVKRMRRMFSAPWIACAHELNIPYTLHVAIGTDIVHQHPTASGAAIGEASLRDFRHFCVQAYRSWGDGGGGD